MNLLKQGLVTQTHTTSIRVLNPIFYLTASNDRSFLSCILTSSNIEEWDLLGRYAVWLL
jgi:hypothetical protein